MVIFFKTGNSLMVVIAGNEMISHYLPLITSEPVLVTRFWKALAGYRMVFNWVVFPAPSTRLYVDGYHSFSTLSVTKFETLTYMKEQIRTNGQVAVVVLALMSC